MAASDSRRRFGIGEWYGKSFVALTPEERTALARVQIDGIQSKACPFRSNSSVQKLCSKKGGICSLRAYDQQGDQVVPAPSEAGYLRVTCPDRFEESNSIYSWVGSVILNDQNPRVLTQIGFLQSDREKNDLNRDNVGKIDNVLISSNWEENFAWCALEKQAVYFQGKGMAHEWETILNHQKIDPPFPQKLRRPDYRSSGPKRLMPQLQIKVPTLRRWGKKTAVVVDESFYSALGKMEEVPDLSSCDIAWFIVGLENKGATFHIDRRRVAFTTLEKAVEGLTAGRPVTQSTFEERIKRKLK